MTASHNFIVYDLCGVVECLCQISLSDLHFEQGKVFLFLSQFLFMFYCVLCVLSY